MARDARATHTTPPGVAAHSGPLLGETSGDSGANRRNIWSTFTHAFNETVDLVSLSASQVPGRRGEESECGDDICRITSPDCPVHAGLADLVTTFFKNRLANRHLRRIRGNGGRRGPSPDTAAEQSHINGPPAPFMPDNSAQPCSSAAIVNSTEILSLAEPHLLTGREGLVQRNTSSCSVKCLIT